MQNDITTGEATYCPEDNKLRLYVGRLPREEYLRLKADGWKPLYKQREAGGGDFVTTWTPSRYATALAYGEGVVLDEDMSPQDRAADRAERFSGYRDKRLDEATGHADRYDSQPAAHGFQSQAKAERAAARHDRIGDRAVDAWDKAEYWQQRTAGVIAHALYKCDPGVRMGRIKELEAQLRKSQSSLDEYAKLFHDFEKIAAMTDAAKQVEILRRYLDTRNLHAEYMHPRPDTVTNARLKTHATSLSTLLSMTRYGYGSDDITGAEACALFFSNHSAPTTDTAWTRHLKLRLAYERQMLGEQGGRLEQHEIEIGGKIGGMLILKINRSATTKRITSCDLLGKKVQGWTYRATNIPGTEWARHQMDTERLSPDSYTAPTPESLAELQAVKKKIEAGKPEVKTIPLINPTDEDAERLQAIFNSQVGHGEDVPTVERMDQATYSRNSKGGNYAPCDTVAIEQGGKKFFQNSDRLYFPIIAKVRVHGRRVIILTDKPQKKFPAEMWVDPKPALIAECESRFTEIESYLQKDWLAERTKEEKDIFRKACLVGLCYHSSKSQYGLTEKGHAWARQQRESVTV